MVRTLGLTNCWRLSWKQEFLWFYQLSRLFLLFRSSSADVKRWKYTKGCYFEWGCSFYFYAPQYVAIENGYFEDEGINLKLVTGFGADKVMTALISGEAQIGFMGSESSIYAYNEGNSDYAVNFAQLTQRAGNFLVSRKPIDNFHGICWREPRYLAEEPEECLKWFLNTSWK